MSSSVFTYFSLCLILTQVYPDADAALICYIGAPLVACTGYILADWRAQVFKCAHYFLLKVKKYICYIAFYFFPL